MTIQEMVNFTFFFLIHIILWNVFLYQICPLSLSYYYVYISEWIEQEGPPFHLE